MTGSSWLGPPGHLGGGGGRGHGALEQWARAPARGRRLSPAPSPRAWALGESGKPGWAGSRTRSRVSLARRPPPTQGRAGSAAELPRRVVSARSCAHRRSAPVRPAERLPLPIWDSRPLGGCAGRGTGREGTDTRVRGSRNGRAQGRAGAAALGGPLPAHAGSEPRPAAPGALSPPARA